MLNRLRLSIVMSYCSPLAHSRYREAIMFPSASVPLCVTRVSALIPETSGATDIPFEQAPEWVTRVAALIPETSGVRDIPFELALRLIRFRRLW